MNKENSKLSGYMLIAVFVVPLVIAIVMYSLRGYLPSTNSVAHGELIHPAKPLKNIQITVAQGGIKSLDNMKGKWTYLVYTPNGCDLECEATLFKLRQAKAATGRDTNRIQLALLIDSGELQDDIAMRNKEVLVGSLDSLELENIPDANQILEPGNIYLLDPLGNMMMRYDEKATAKGILKDIKKLLKISNIG